MLLSTIENSALVGFTGLVGGILKGQRSFSHFYNSKNIDQIHGRHFDVIYFSAIPAEKWKANQDPARDEAVVNAIIDHMKTVTADLFVLISTIDVYKLGTPERYDESSDLSGYMASHHAYGKNRFLFEQFVADHFKNHVIVRLPALFGPGLKKNYIYDLMRDNGVDKLKRNSCFQWYDLTRLDSDIQICVKNGIKIVNLFPEPIWTDDLIRVAVETRAVPKKIADKVPAPQSDSADIVYKVYTKHGPLFGGDGDYIYNAQTTLDNLARFFRREIASRKVALSNIAWEWNDAAEHAKVMDIIDRYGVKNLEIAPTKIWKDWAGCKEALASGKTKAFGALLRDLNFNVSSYQAILFALPECQLVKDEESRKNFIDHLKFIIDLASDVASTNASKRAPALVLGAPKNRLKFDLPEDKCDEIAVKVFREIGDYASSKNVVVCLEANPPAYGCEYLNNATSAARMVRMVNSPGFRLHLDLACMFLANDDITKAITENVDILYHIHISEPYLEEINQNAKAPHQLFSQLLSTNVFESDVYWSIEMKNGDDNVKRVEGALSHVFETYFVTAHLHNMNSKATQPLNSTKFESKFRSTRERVLQYTSQTHLTSIPWSLSPPLPDDYRLPEQLLEFSREFLKQQAAIVEKSHDLTVPNVDVEYSERNRTTVDASEVANIILLLSIYVRSSYSRFQEIHKDYGLYSYLCDICLDTPVLHDYFSYFLAHLCTSGVSACETIVYRSDLRSFLQKIVWNGRLVPNYEVAYKLLTACSIAKHVSIKRKLLEGNSVLKTCLTFVNSICELYRNVYDPSTIRSTPMVCLIHNTFKFLKYVSKDCSDEDRIEWFRWADHDQKPIHRLCTLLCLELVSFDVKEVILECIPSITPYRNREPDRYLEYTNDRNLMINACKVTWIHVSNEMESDESVSICDAIIHALRSIFVKFPSAYEPEIFVPFTSLWMAATAVLDNKNCFEKMNSERIQSTLVCFQYAFQAQFECDQFLIYKRIFNLFEGFALRKYKDQELLARSLNTMCNLLAGQTSPMIELKTLVYTLYRILFNNPNLRPSNQSLVFRCLFNVCTSETVAIGIMELGYPKILDYLDLSNYAQETFVDALYLIAHIMSFNPNAFFMRVEPQFLKAMYSFVHDAVFWHLNPNIPDVCLGQEMQESRVVDVIISIIFASVQTKDIDVLEMLVNLGYDRLINQFGYETGSAARLECIEVCNVIMDEWKKSKKTKVFARVAEKYGMKGKPLDHPPSQTPSSATTNNTPHARRSTVTSKHFPTQLNKQRRSYNVAV